MRFVKIIAEHKIIDSLFLKWREALGRDYPAYRNHAYRVFNFACELAKADGGDVEKLAIASAFHDVGIWLDNTFDYLAPSIQRASDYLSQTGHEEWIGEVGHIINFHHKIFPWRSSTSTLVEAFRRADWVDVCLFALPTRLPRQFMAEVLRCFPREGFHGRLVYFTWRWVKQHPFRPLPMFKL